MGSTPQLRTAEGFLRIKKRYADTGIKVWNIGNTSVHCMPEVTLDLPGREQKIEEYKQYLRNLGKAGISYTTYAHMGNGIWTSGRADVRGASAREFDLSSPNKKGYWGDRVWQEPFPRAGFFQEEIWENYSYFIKRVAPVAEQAGVRIGIHPDDPPVPVLAGVPPASSVVSKGTSGPWKSPTARTSGSACAVAPGSKAAPGSRERPRRDDPPLRSREDLEDSFP